MTRKTKIKRGAALAIFLACAATMTTAQTANPVRTLRDYIAMAEAGNPGLAAARNRRDAAVAAARQAGSLPDPKLKYGYYVEPVETRVGPQEQRFGLSQTFPAWGKRGLRGDIARLAAEEADAEVIRRQWALRRQVTEVYTEWIYLEAAIRTTREVAGLLEDLERVASARNRAGASQADVLRTQVELGKIENRIASLEDRKRPLQVRFNALLNRYADSPIETVDPAAGPPVELPGDLTLRLVANNPELRALMIKTARSRRGVSLARRANLPDVSLGIEYIDTGEAEMAGVADNGKDPVIATVALNIPLWLGRNRARVDESTALVAEADSMLENRGNLLAATLEDAAFAYRDAVRRLRLYRDTLVPRATQAAAVSLTGYENGNADYQSVMDAQRTLLEFTLAAERAAADVAIRRAEIESLIASSLQEE